MRTRTGSGGWWAGVGAAAAAAALQSAAGCSDETAGGAGPGAASATGGGTAGGATGGAHAGGAAGGAAVGGAAAGGAAAAGGSGATGGDGGSTTAAACPAGSVIEALDPNAGYAEYGAVFSSTPYQRDVEGSHNPQPIVARVTASGVPVDGCDVSWELAPGHGWVFAERATTDGSGEVRAYWTAGNVPAPTARARILLEGGGDHTTDFTGVATASPGTRSNSVHLLYATPEPWTEFEVSVTPVTGPQSTYYSTINWPGAYGGIQFDSYGGVDFTMVIFSVWDVDPSHEAEIVDPGACNETVDFGGEGTGTSCRLRLPPSEHGDVAGLPVDYMLQPGDTYQTRVTLTDCGPACTDYSFSFTDVTRGLGPVSLGTQRYRADASPSYASSFIEDWYENPGDDCISAGARTTYFHDIAGLTQSGWHTVRQAEFSPNYLQWNHEICANYYAGADDERFLVSSGGDGLVSRPKVEGGAFFSENPVVELP